MKEIKKYINKIKNVFEKLNYEKILLICKIVVVFLIPSLYTVTYLAANADPYNAMDEVPVAIINLDKGYTIQGEKEEIGKDVAQGLIDSKGFAFKLETPETFSFDDYFMKITIPENFSESILNFQNNNYKQAQIKLDIDESKNYIFSSVAQESLYEMQGEINTEILQSYLMAGVSVAGATQDLLNKYNEIITEYITTTSNEIDSKQEKLMNKVETDFNFYNTSKAKVQKDGNAFIDKVNNNLNDFEKQINEIYNIPVENYNNLIADYEALVDAVQENVEDPQLLNILKDFDNAIKTEKNKIDIQKNAEKDKIDKVIQDEQSKLNKIKEKGSVTKKELKEIDSDINDMHSFILEYNKKIDIFQEKILSNKYLNNKITLNTDFASMINFFSSPIVFKANRENQVENYGEGLAPFFIPLSLYIGALILVTILPLVELKKQLPKLKAKHIILINMAVALFQVGILYFLLTFINGITFISPVKFIIYSYCLSLSFISAIVFLELILGDVGKFFVFILLILQLGGSAGTFPIETSPPFFKFISPFLPLSYAVTDYRHILFIKDISITLDIIFMVVLILILNIILYKVVKKKIIKINKKNY